MKLFIDAMYKYFIDLQMKPYRTDEYVHKLFYETSRFTAFNHQWVVKARINNSQRDPHTVTDRKLSYQVCTKNKLNTFQVCIERWISGIHLTVHNQKK